MRRALRLASKGRGRVEPNPMVGAVVVKRGKIVGEGYHQKFGGPHAEVNAVRAAGAAVRGATVYVTLEPCSHHGKTPPCAALLIDSKVSRVVAAMEDPDDRVVGNGFRRLREAGIEVETGLLGEQARELNAPYLKLRTQGTPYVIAKWATTLDGRIATPSGDSKWITGEVARRHVHRVRNRVDAILVGIGTALEDDPLLTCRLPGGRNPTRIVLDSRARLPLDSQLVRTVSEAEVILVTTSAAPKGRARELRDAGVAILTVRTRKGVCSLRHLAQKLGEMQITNLMVEGGAETLAAFFAAGLVDRAMVYLAPKVIGDGPTPVSGLALGEMADAIALQQVRTRRLGDDFLVDGVVGA